MSEPAVFLKEWSDWRDMVVVNIMRHGSIDKHLARELAEHFQNMTPQRTWVGLTREEAKEICLANRPYVVDMVIALEAELKKRNGFTDEENT